MKTDDSKPTVEDVKLIFSLSVMIWPENATIAQEYARNASYIALNVLNMNELELKTLINSAVEDVNSLVTRWKASAKLVTSLTGFSKDYAVSRAAKLSQTKVGKEVNDLLDLISKGKSSEQEQEGETDEQ